MKAFHKVLPWLFVAAASAACVVFWIRFPELHDKLRMIGMALQLTGLALVVAGIIETRERLGRGLAEVARALLSRFKRAAPVHHVASGDLRAGPAIVAGQGTVGATVHHTLEERVGLLETALNGVRAEGAAAVRTETSERAAALEAERQARESSDGAILEGIKREVLRKHPQELFGTELIFIGIILGTVPKEVECLVRWIFL